MASTVKTNVNELRGSILSLIAGIENEQYLRQILLQLQPFLKDTAKMKDLPPTRNKSKGMQKEGKSPVVPPKAPRVPFAKKYPSQPTPEEAEKILAEMIHHKAQQIGFDSKSYLQAQTQITISEKEWVQRAEALHIEEPVEELLALLTK